MTGQEPVARRASLRGATLAITNLTKLAGVVMAVNEGMIRAEVRPGVLALAGFMMAGAVVSEQVLLTLVDRFLGRESK